MISIIIIVKNDRKINKLLENLGKITRPDKTEVIVVDASRGSLDDIKNKHNSVRWIYFDNIHNKKTTIPDQRNVGVSAAKGDIIVFIDSDCVPDKEWLTEIAKPIKDDNEYIVAGRVELEDKNSPHEIASEKKRGNKYIDECPTMNVAYKHSLFEKIGQFDERFQYGSDVDLSWRAIRAGYKIRLNEKAIIYHDLGDAKNDFRRMYVYGKARLRLYKKHTYRWRYFIGNEMLYTLYPLYFLLLPLTFIFPLYPFFILVPILKNWNRKPVNLVLTRTIYGIGIIKEIISPPYYLSYDFNEKRRTE